MHALVGRLGDELADAGIALKPTFVRRGFLLTCPATAYDAAPAEARARFDQARRRPCAAMAFCLTYRADGCTAAAGWCCCPRPSCRA